MLVVLVDNSYGPGGPGVVLAGVLVVLVGNSYGPGGPWVVLAGLLMVLVDICMVPVVLVGCLSSGTPRRGRRQPLHIVEQAGSRARSWSPLCVLFKIAALLGGSDATSRDAEGARG